MPLDETNAEFVVHCDTELDYFEFESDAIAKANELIRGAKADWNDGWPDDVEGIFVAKVLRRAQQNDPNLDYRVVEYVLKDLKGREGAIGDCPLCEGSGESGRDYFGEVNSCHYCDRGAITKDIIQSTRDALDGLVGDAMYADHEFGLMVDAFNHLKTVTGDRKSQFIKENGRHGESPWAEFMGSVESYIAAKKSQKSMSEQPVG